MRNYDPFKAPTHFKLTRSAEEVRQDLRRDQVGRKGQVRQGERRPDGRRHREAPRRPLELPVHRRHVVPGSLQLRLPPHRDVHHPVCHAAGRDFLLRVQHRHRLAQHHREDAHDGDAHQVVRGARPPRDLRRRQGRAARLDRALAEAERRKRSAPARRPTSTSWASPRTRARRSSRRAERRTRTRATTRRWPSFIGSTCSRSSRRCRFRASAARRSRTSQPVLHKPQV